MLPLNRYIRLFLQDMARVFSRKSSVKVLMLAVLSIISPALSHMILGSYPINSTRVAVWCNQPISSFTQIALRSMADDVSKRLNVSLLLDFISLSFSAGEAYQVLERINSRRQKTSRYLVTNLDLKRTWLWAKMLGNMESVVLGVERSGKSEIHKNQFFLQNYVSLVPPESEKIRIIGDILNHILCKETANIKCNMSDNAVDNDIRSQLNATREMNSCIVVHCTEKLGEIFLLANEYDLLGTQYRWFLLNYVVIDQTFEELPQNLMSIELSHYDDQSNQVNTSCGNVSFLDDALVLIASLEKDFGSGFNRRSNDLRRNILETNFAGKTGQVYFDDSQHTRKGSDYRIFQLVQFSNSTGWLCIGSWRNNSFDTTLKSWIQHEVARIKPPLLRIATKYSKPWVFFTAAQEIDKTTSKCIIGTKCINYTHYVSEDNNSFVSHCCSGMLIELLEELTKRISFTPRLHFVKDNKFGGKNASTGAWNGMIGEVLREEADTALYSLTITESRSKAVDFSYPFLASGSGIIISTQGEKFLSHINASFLKPFSRNLWMVTLGIFASCFLILWAAERWNHRRVFDRGPRVTRGVGRFLESMSYTWGVVVQKVVQEGGPKTFGGRVVTGIFGFYMIILLSTYTANLAAIQVIEEEQEEISGIYDDKFINPSNEFKFTSSKFTSTSEFFKQSPDPRMRKIYATMKDRLVSTRAEARALLKSGEIQAFFEDTPSLHYMASQEKACDLKVVGKSFGNSGYGMPFRRNSAWSRKFTASFRKMHEDGTMRKLGQKWLESGCVVKAPNAAREMGVRDESGLLFLLAIVCVGSFMVLALEFVCVRIFANSFDSHSRSFTYNVAK